jgi:hypothetical protein
MNKLLLALLLLCAAEGCSDGPCTPAWSPVFAQPLNRSVLSIFGNRRSDFYLVGGGLGVAGTGALALHFDGHAWRELSTGRTETLWWGFVVPGTSDAWMVGENGLILRFDGTSFRVVPSGTGATLYGVWGSAANDIWIVGGLPGRGASPDNDVVLRWDGQMLSRDMSVTPKGATFFKVWGASAGDVWISGELGTLWRHTTAGWQDHSADIGARDSLLTVHGCSANEVYTVGGTSVYTFDGRAWTTATQAPSGANGVSCGKNAVLVVGNAGTKIRFDRARSTWVDDRFAEPWRTDFHGAWVSPEGELWAGGGNFQLPASAGSRNGIVGYYGCAPPPSSL